jgi:hypothetical protein
MQLQARERAHRIAGRVRAGLVGAAVLAVVLLRFDAIPWVVGLAVLFGAATFWHIQVLNARDRAARGVAWYTHGLARLRHEWIGIGDAGDRFRPPEHPYADDLDLFGRGSLFQRLSTARTHTGQITLARWLLAPAAAGEVRARQAAVRELAQRPALREAMAIEGDGVYLEATALREWATAPPALPRRWVALPLAAISGVNATLLVWYLSTGDYDLWSLGAMIVAGLVAWSLNTRVRRVIGRIETPVRDLVVVSHLLRVLERETFAAPRLIALRDAIGGQSRPASSEIAHLERLVGRLAWRRDMLFGIPAALMMWATQIALAIDGWRRRAGADVPRWLDAVGEFEALSALATFAYEESSAAWPTLDDGAEGPTFSAAALAHPLLPASAVANDIAIGDNAPALLVVSGSNMSGKSTFLRAVGLNAVLAQAGAPVRATHCALTPLQLGASIRIVDSLLEGRSRFFAEITRLKLVVDLTKAHPGGVLFLLDEVLSGTNSHDRAAGAASLLRGLLDYGAIGLVTTHDLALSGIADSLAPRGANVHFADAFDEGGLQFDYRLRPGPVRTSNALALMRSIGLDV